MYPTRMRRRLAARRSPQTTSDAQSLRKPAIELDTSRATITAPPSVCLRRRNTRGRSARRPSTSIAVSSGSASSSSSKRRMRRNPRGEPPGSSSRSLRPLSSTPSKARTSGATSTERTFGRRGGGSGAGRSPSAAGETFGAAISVWAPGAGSSSPAVIGIPCGEAASPRGALSSRRFSSRSAWARSSSSVAWSSGAMRWATMRRSTARSSAPASIRPRRSAWARIREGRAATKPPSLRSARLPLDAPSRPILRARSASRSRMSRMAPTTPGGRSTARTSASMGATCTDDAP